MKYFSYSFLSLFLVIVSCGSVEVSPDDKNTNLVASNFGQYLAIGSGFTAGYTQGGLFRDGQNKSFPNLLAQQLKQIGATDFKQPLFDASQANGTGFMNAKSLNPLTTEKTAGNAIRGTSPLLFSKFSGANHNLGIPNMKMSDVGKPGLGNSKNAFFNPFFERLLPDAQLDQTYVSLVKNAKFDFFTCEFGLNDVLDYAQSGGTKILGNVENVAGSCRQIFTVLGEKKVKGFVLNIPNVEEMPYFVKAGSLKTPIFITSAGKVRMATENELVMLPIIEKIGKPNGNSSKYGLTETEALKNEEVLDASELNRLRQTIGDLNQVISVEAKSQNLAVIDVNAVFSAISSGNFKDNKGVAVKAEISNTGFYSVDGVYPTSKGSAILANEVIKLLNIDLKNNKQKEIPAVDLSILKGVEVK